MKTILLIAISVLLSSCVVKTVQYDRVYYSSCKPIQYCDRFPTQGERNSCSMGIRDCIRDEAYIKNTEAYNRGRYLK
ncbi:hypothetical protein EBU95_03600 [bacterium]|nr:hypothetical protein [bacterium]